MAESDHKLEKYTHHYWCEELKASKEARAKLLETAERSIKVYAKKHKLADTEREIGIWWSLVNTLLPAYFSKVPKVDVTQRRKRGGDVYRLAGLAWEYSTQYAIEEHFNFTDVGYRSVLQFILAGEAVLWARYDADFKDTEYEYSLLKGEDGSYKTEDGKDYELDEERAEIMESDDGSPPMVKEMVEELHTERAILEVVSIRDYRCGIASSPDQIPWKAKRCYLSRDQAKKKFGEDSDLFNYNSYPEDQKTDKKQKLDYEGKAEIWEIWCKTTGSVYWLHEGGKEKFLKKQEPPVDYQNFWPCVDIHANTEPDCITPFGDYVECEDLILEAERLTTRIHATIEFIRTNFAYDASMGDVIENLFEGDLKGIPVQQSSAQRAKGSLGDSLFFLPIDSYIKALQSLYEAREQTLGKLYESLACSDLLRGQSVAIKTATANNLESNYASLRFSVRREQVARFLTDGIKKIGEIIATKFAPETVYEMSFGEELVQELPDPEPVMPQMPMGMPPQDPNMGMPPEMGAQPPMMMPPPPPVDPFTKFLELYEILKASALRNFKLDIESDSLVELDQAADRQERVDAMSSSGAFLQQLEPLLKSAPSTAKFAKGMMRFVLRTYKAGKDIEGDLMGALDSMIMELEQAKQNQKDPTEAQNQAFLQVEQMKAQLKDKELMIEQAAKDIELQQANQKLMMDAQNAQGELQIKSSQIGANMQIAEMENSLKIEALKIEAAKLEQKNQEAAVQVQLKAMKEAFDQKMQDAYLKLDEFSVIAKENEKLIEEKRLASQERMETLKIISDQISQVNQMKQAQTQQVAAASAPKEKAEKSQPVVVNLHTGGGKQREVVVKRSKDGSLVGRTRDVEDEEGDDNDNDSNKQRRK